MSSLSTQNLGVNSTSASPNATGSRRADGQSEGPNPERASASGPIASGNLVSSSEGIDNPQMREHAQETAKGGGALHPSQESEATQA